MLPVQQQQSQTAGTTPTTTHTQGRGSIPRRFQHFLQRSTHCFLSRCTRDAWLFGQVGLQPRSQRLDVSSGRRERLFDDALGRRGTFVTRPMFGWIQEHVEQERSFQCCGLVVIGRRRQTRYGRPCRFRVLGFFKEFLRETKDRRRGRRRLHRTTIGGFVVRSAKACWRCARLGGHDWSPRSASQQRRRGKGLVLTWLQGRCQGHENGGMQIDLHFVGVEYSYSICIQRTSCLF